jgi:N6-adenosine-specific RNA methylase IME4
MQSSPNIQALLKTRTDLSEYFVETGNRPQNFIQENEPEERFKDYPKTQELLKMKNALLKKRNHPAMYLKSDIREVDFANFPKFDVVLIDPPWEEYKKRILNISMVKKTEKSEGWTLEEIRDIRLDQIAASPSFIFLWCGSEHLDHGRLLFKHWGLKRCEDVVWIKSNTYTNKYNPSHADDYSFLKRTKEHCLVGIKGDTKRASEPSFIHPNIDTDVIMTEEPDIETFDKPEELYDIIERFCLGRRRIELFGNNKSIRPGWFTIGKDLSTSNFNTGVYESWFEGEVRLDGYQGGKITGTTPEIESLRPKSPPKQNN